MRSNTQTLAAPLSAGIDLDGVRAALRTEHSWSLTLLRVTLGVVVLPHGAQKVFGWFGGYGFEGTMGFLTGTMGLPWVVGALVIAAESLGALALVIGLFGRLAALGIASVMLGAMLTVHLQQGFFMDWNGTMAGEGFEYHLLAIAMALVVALRGSGALSLDRALTRARRS